MDFAYGDSDPGAREATARSIFLARAYLNLGAALATEAECWTSCSIKFIEVITRGVPFELCNYSASLDNNLFSCGSLTTVVCREDWVEASDDAQYPWVLEFSKMTYNFHTTASIKMPSWRWARPSIGIFLLLMLIEGFVTC